MCTLQQRSFSLIEVRATSADLFVEQRDLPGVIQVAMNRAVQHEIVRILFPERMRLFGKELISGPGV
jgi:hypothetical protein